MEQLYSYYGLPVDTWSLGCIMYNLLCGKSPFPYGNTDENYENIKRARYWYSRDKANKISQEAKDLIELILNLDPELRPTMDEILEHPFFTNPSDGVPLQFVPRSLPRTILNYPLSEDYITSLRLRASNAARIEGNLDKSSHQPDHTGTHNNLDNFEENSFAVDCPQVTSRPMNPSPPTTKLPKTIKTNGQIHHPNTTRNELSWSKKTCQFVRVNYWLAYPNYGIGYLLSNGSVGELMPDKTSLFYTPDRARIMYNQDTDGDNVRCADDAAAEVDGAERS